MDRPIIETKKLCKAFSTGGLQQQVLKNLDSHIYEEDFTVIMGASGGGKSTLLCLIIIANATKGFIYPIKLERGVLIKNT